MKRLSIACLGLAGLLAATVPVRASEDELPIATQLDVRESYRLLATTFYRNVDAKQLFDGAETAITTEARKHGARVALPDLRDLSPDEALNQLDQAIVRSAGAAHETPTQMAYAAVSGMASGLGDRWTTFMSPDDYKRFTTVLDPEKISGIGVLIAPDTPTGYISVTYVVPGTPAERAGLQSGDDILTIDGVSTKGMTAEDVTKVLRGRAGTVAHINVQRDGKSLPAMAIVRQSVAPPTVVYRMLPDKIAYIAVFTFGLETPEQFSQAMQRAQRLGARAIVMDLRNNGGGYVDSALAISSQFISNKPLVTVQDRASHVQTVQADENPVWSGPVTVLVNGYSASASEITAGALQDDGVATLVGTKTFGKGVMQTVTQLADGSAIKITTQRYFTPANRDINLRGIEPDVRVDENKQARLGILESDAQLRAAVAVLQKKIAATTP